MTKHIHLSDRDASNLERLQSQNDRAQPTQPKDYSNKVVVKPWGYEFLIFENEHVAIWYLHLDFEQSTSMHCHPTKKTSLVVLDGKALCNTFLRRYYLDAIDGVILDQGVFHSTKCLSKNGLDLIEIETPPNKTDLVRLEDEYGRAKSGYEGLSEMKTVGLNRYNYFELSQALTQLPTCTLRMLSYSNNDEFQEHFTPNLSDIYCLCGGEIVNVEKTPIAHVGEAVGGDYLDSFKELSIQGELNIIQVSPRN